jgi:hypothetical protein
MADKNALELIGVMLLATTILVIGAGGFVVRSQLVMETQRSENVALVAQFPAPAVNANLVK